MNKKLKSEILFALNRATVNFRQLGTTSIYDITLRNNTKICVKYDSISKIGSINDVQMCDNTRPSAPSTQMAQQDMIDIKEACMKRYLERIETMTAQERELFYLIRGARPAKMK